MGFNAIDFPWTSDFFVLRFLSWSHLTTSNIATGEESWETAKLVSGHRRVQNPRNSWLLRKYYVVKHQLIRSSGEMLICQRVQRYKRNRCPLPLISTWLYSVGWRKSCYLGLFITKRERNCTRKVRKLPQCVFKMWWGVTVLILIFL